MGTELNEKCYELLAFVADYCAEHQYSPSVRDMMDAVDLRSESSVARWIGILQKRHYVSVTPKLARSIRMTPQGLRALGRKPLLPRELEQSLTKWAADNGATISLQVSAQGVELITR